MLYEQIPKNYFKGALNSYKSHYSFWVFDKQCCSFVLLSPIVVFDLAYTFLKIKQNSMI